MATSTNQERYGKMVLAKLRADTVMKDGVIFNNEYDGDPKAGAVKIPVRDTEVIVDTYSPSAGLAVKATAATSYQLVSLDEDLAINELIDGFDAASVPDDKVAERLDSGAYSMALNLDVRGGTALLGSGTNNYVLYALDKDTIYNAIVDLRTAMSKAKIPNDGKRFLLVSPDCYALILKDTDHFIGVEALSAAQVADGAIGKIAGFTVYEWQIDSTNAAAYPYAYAVAGHPKWCSRVREWGVAPHIQDLNGSGTFIGASAVQGRMVNKHTVTRATAVQILNTITPLTLAFAAGTTGTTTCTVTGAVTGTSTYRYRVNPAVNAVYGQTAVNGTNGFVTFTSGGANGVTVAVGATLEVVQVLTSTGKVVARNDHVMLTAEVGA